MRKILIAAALILGALPGQAQEKVMNIQRTDGTISQTRVADMKQINPEYLQMNQITRNLTDRTVVPMLVTTTSTTATSITHSVESRNSGGGGHSSIGGGGGFSGGGSGGGVR